MGLMGRHSQVVRQRSAKPLFPSSSLGVASIRTDSIGISPFFCLKAKKHSVLIRGAFPFLSFFIKIGLRKNDARGKSWYNMVVSKEKFFNLFVRSKKFFDAESKVFFRFFFPVLLREKKESGIFLWRQNLSFPLRKAEETTGFLRKMRLE